MKNGFEAGCNCSETMITIPAEEYKQLVYESARNDIVRHLFLAEQSAYIDTNAVRIAMGISPIIRGNQPFAYNHVKENTDE